MRTDDCRRRGGAAHPRSQRGRLMASMAGVTLLLTSCATLAGPRVGETFPTASPAKQQPRWVLTLDDEFNGQVSQPTNWNYSRGGSGWSHRELQYYTPTNASTDGRGHLVLQARKNGARYTCWYGPCRYTSARISTQGYFSQAYGKFEARIKLPKGPGIWPGLWMQSPDEPACGEIDIIETNTANPRLVEAYSHAVGQKHAAYLTTKEPLASGYHVYGITWTPSGIAWTFDGKVYSYLHAYPGWAFHCPLYMILQLAVGGGWPGRPKRTTPFPAKLSIDWIRVYREAR